MSDPKNKEEKATTPPETDGAEESSDAAEPAEPTIEDRLAEAQTQSAGHYDQFLRARAELDNVIKRHERERGDRAKYAAESLARDLLPVLDDLDRALEHAGDDPGDGGTSLAEGVVMVRSAMTEVLGRHGVERIETSDQAFDPAEHEAVATVESDRHRPGTVVEEHRAGYRVHDRLLRPAMVVVAKEPSGGQDGEGG